MSDDLIDAGMRNEIIARLSERLSTHYLFPEVAREMVQTLQRRQNAGEYAHLTSGTELCLRLSEHLREICHDTHLHVRYSIDSLEMAEPGPDLEALAPQEHERSKRSIR